MKILVVDDDSQVAQLLSRVLTEEGFQAEIAARGSEALKLFNTGSYGMVLLDLYLPDTTGLELLQKIHSQNPSMPVLIMTGRAEIQTAVQAMKLGAIDYLVKPFEMDRLKATLRALHERLSDTNATELTKHIVGASPQIMEVWEQVSRYALPDVSILLTGESGTGKELFARAIHERSKRRAQPFVALDCATLPDTLVESELFGHEKGAFTGATEKKIGRIEIAEGGTLFLDEIGNLTLQIQAKLLRVVQEKYIHRLGGRNPVPIDVRIVSATNLDLEQAIRKNTFREDLYYRLAEVVIRLPPLRERRGDIDLLTEVFVQQFNRRFNRQVRGICEPAWSILRNYKWPGNVRELQNAIKASLLAAEDQILTEHLPEYLRRGEVAPVANSPDDHHFQERIERDVEAGLQSGSLELASFVAKYGEEVEREVLSRILRRGQFTQEKLSALLGVDPKTLRKKLQKFGLKTR